MKYISEAIILPEIDDFGMAAVNLGYVPVGLITVFGIIAFIVVTAITWNAFYNSGAKWHKVLFSAVGSLLAFTTIFFAIVSITAFVVNANVTKEMNSLIFGIDDDSSNSNLHKEILNASLSDTPSQIEYYYDGVVYNFYVDGRVLQFDGGVSQGLVNSKTDSPSEEVPRLDEEAVFNDPVAFVDKLTSEEKAALFEALAKEAFSSE